MCKYFPVWLIYAKEWFIYRIDLFFFLFPESRIMITKEREGERMRKKLIFLDLDGTLWHGDHQIPPKHAGCDRNCPAQRPQSVFQYRPEPGRSTEKAFLNRKDSWFSSLEKMLGSSFFDRRSHHKRGSPFHFKSTDENEPL